MSGTSAQTKDKNKPGTIEVSPVNTPVAPNEAVNTVEVADLQAELDRVRAELAAKEAELAAARNVTAEPVEIELESGAPKWVRLVSGMERSEIKGWVELPSNLLIVTDKRGGQHRFTFLDRQRAA